MSNSTFAADITIEQLVTAEKMGIRGNDPQKVEAFKDKAFGLFIHWSVDCVIGTAISHWMCGADYGLIDQFINETPKDFNPKYFDADDIAALAKQAGMKYFVFTTKHHNGFCMYDTKTTPFNIMNTPFGRDVTKELIAAFRKKGLWSGLYFSPWDLLWVYQQGKQMHLSFPDTLPANNPELMTYNQTQLQELLHNYRDIDMTFFDGPAEGLKNIVWQEQKHCLVTRGEMKTPENGLSGIPSEGAWEACYTMGQSWGYRPYGDKLRTPRELIELLIKIRAQGGNLLLNIYPDPLGRIPQDQVNILREVGTYIFFNQEALYEVRPWKVTNEPGVWYTKKKDENTVYAFVTEGTWDVGFDYKDWNPHWHNIHLKSIRATKDTQIEIVGQSGLLIEHLNINELNPKTTWKQDNDGLHIRCIVCYRGRDDRKWDFPIVLRITNPE